MRDVVAIAPAPLIADLLRDVDDEKPLEVLRELGREVEA